MPDLRAIFSSGFIFPLPSSREIFASVRVLAEKLYRRNPREWKKGGHASVEAALDRLLDPRTGWRLAATAGRNGTDAILLALRADFDGDRVAAFIAGMGSMLNAAFEEKTEFFMLDDLDPQKLYNSARNLEIAAWKLANARDAQIALNNQLIFLLAQRSDGRLSGVVKSFLGHPKDVPQGTYGAISIHGHDGLQLRHARHAGEDFTGAGQWKNETG